MENEPSKLDDMITEAGGIAPAEGGEVAAVSTAPAPLPEYIKGLTGSLVTVAGAIACDRANVTRLEPVEVAQLSDALANVLRFYLTVDGMDEKAVAWITVGAVAIGVIGNRRPLAPRPPVVEIAPDAPLEPDAPEEVVAAQMGAVDKLMGAANDNAPSGT